MSTGEQNPDSNVDAVATVEPAEGEAPEKVKTKLDLEVVISDTGPCKKHLKVSISRDDINKQFEETFGNMKREAAVPGFRPGRAPRQLVEKMFKKQVAGQATPGDLEDLLARVRSSANVSTRTTVAQTWCYNGKTRASNFTAVRS